MLESFWATFSRSCKHQSASYLLSRARHALNRWNKERVGNLFNKDEQCELKISALQEKEMGCGLFVEKLKVLRGYLADYHITLRLQEILWKQKSQIQWLLGGDANSSFFHRVVTARRRTNCIQAISNDDDCCIG